MIDPNGPRFDASFRTLRRLATLALATLALAAPAAGQRDDPGDGETRQGDQAVRPELFVDSVDVNIVNVEVIVTDRNGNPVKGLTVDDFKVFDDGQPVAISNFYRVEDNQRVETIPLTATPASPGAEATPANRREPAGVIILVDNAHISAANRKKVFSALDRSLDRILVQDAHVMIVNKDLDIRIEQRFTQDRGEIEAALERIGSSAGSASFGEAVRQRTVRAIEAADEATSINGDLAARETLDQVLSYANQEFENVRRTTRVLQAFINSMSGMPGRKALIYVSDNLAVNPGEDVFSVWWAKYGPVRGQEVGVFSVRDLALEFDATEVLLELIADANSSRVAFYPVGTDTSSTRRALSPRNSGMTQTPAFFAQNYEAPDHAGLRFLARTTGGDAAFGIANTSELLDQVRQDLTHFYSLGYPSPHRGDGEQHRIEVKVERPGVTVRYLDTYRDKSSDQQMNDQTLAALFFEDGANPLGVRLLVGEMEAKKDHYLVPIEVRFPLANVTLVPEKKEHVGNISIFVVTRDSQGRLTNPAKIPVPVRIPSAKMPLPDNQIAAYATKLAMRRGEQTIAVGVRDDYASVSSTLRAQITVGSDDEGAEGRKGRRRGKG